jgi:hypothetical protein
VVDDPLDAAMALFRVMRLALGKGASDDLDSADCMDLWTLADLTDDLLRQHKAATEEAGHRLRAFTHQHQK